MPVVLTGMALMEELYYGFKKPINLLEKVWEYKAL